jgi:hypothetical protein
VAAASAALSRQGIGRIWSATNEVGWPEDAMRNLAKPLSALATVGRTRDEHLAHLAGLDPT